MIILKTVLKSGGVYKPEHVIRIRDMLDKYVDCPAQFVCYSDINIPGVTVRKLQDNLPGWWSKIEMFRDVDEQSFYIDLDMTVNGNITDIVSHKSYFIATRNMNSRIGGIGTSVMGWEGDHSDVYRHFINNKDAIMQAYGKHRMGTAFLGDQGFLWEYHGMCEYYQDLFPKRMKKFSENVNADVVVYFGKNKPWGRV